METQTLTFWDKIFNNTVEFNRFGVISFALIASACMGGIAVGLGAIESTFQVVLAVVAAMTVLALILAVQPVKWILNATAIALILDVILIVYNLIV